MTSSRNDTPRRNIALAALSFGAFVMGIAEFAPMGLIGAIARDLAPDFDTNPEGALAQAGTLISAYALGVVIGAPVIGVLASRRPQNRLAIWLLGLAIVTNLGTAFLSGHELSAAARFCAGLPHGAYLGVASLLAGRLLGEGKQGQGVALALSGLTVANVLGVPLATWAGQGVGWRWIFAAVALGFALVVVVLVVSLPTVPGDSGTSALSELRAFTRLRFWMIILIGAIGFGGFFAIYAYVSEVATRVTGLEAAVTPFVLITIGLGMVAGNLLGGRGADRSIPRTTVTGFLFLIVALLAYLLFAATPVGLFATVFLIGVGAWMFTPAVQSWLIVAAEEQRLLGAAMNHAAFNAANSLGAFAGGLAISAGFGYLSPAVVGIILAAVGLLLVFVVIGYEKRQSHASKNQSSG